MRFAHQIKTPIASMCLHLQNEDSALSRKLSSDLFRIEQYADMVLAFLRLDSESTDYVFREYDLDKIVKEAVKKFSSEFIGRKLSLMIIVTAVCFSVFALVYGLVYKITSNTYYAIVSGGKELS